MQASIKGHIPNNKDKHNTVKYTSDGAEIEGTAYNGRVIILNMQP
jgi:hypothetical protein